MARRLAWVWLLIVFLAAPCAAKTLVVVLLPGTSLSDWRQADAPNLHEVMATGAVAMMNTRTARLPSDRVRETPESAVLTLGAGARAAGGPEATDFQRTDLPAAGMDVTAGELFARRTGLRPPPGSRVNVQWPRVLRENQGRGYDIHLGNLGDALQRAGVTVKAVGGPLAYALAAKGTGSIVPALPHPGGADSGERFLIWDAGNNIEAADRGLGALLARLGTGRLIVLSPSAGDAAYARGSRLCPVAVWEADLQPGLVYSAATRRAGLVVDTDFAVTVADYFGIGLDTFPARPFGTSPWRFRPAADAVRQAADLDIAADGQWRGMKVLPYLAVLLGLWMLAWTAQAWFRHLTPWAGLLPIGLVFALTVGRSPLGTGLWLAGLTVIAAVSRRLGAWRIALSLSLVIVTVLVADMLLGDPLMRRGLLGYSVIEGARYYGLGNEAMGALVGASLVTVDGLWSRVPGRRRYLLWLCLALTTALLGSPLAGAKAGGLIVALATFGAFGWLRSCRTANWQTLFLGATGIAAVLLSVAILDSHFPAGQQSHFGQAVARLGAGGAGEWADIIARKLSVEGRLLYHSAWALPLWGGLASLLWLTRHGLLMDRPFKVAGIVAVAACLAFNDAGTEAAALCLSLLWGWTIAQAEQKSPGQAAATAAPA